MASKGHGGLGKGLGALLKNREITPAKDQVQEIAASEIQANRYQPRQSFDEEALEDLSESIRQYGILQPLIVRRLPGKGYELIAGERRLRAARKAGLEKVPALVREYNDAEISEIALIENIQRENLNIIEEAEAYAFLMKNFRLTQEMLAKKVGRSRPHIANSLRLLELAEEIQDKLVAGDLLMGQARPLLALKDKALQVRAAEHILEEHLSSRQAEELVRRLLDDQPISTHARAGQRMSRKRYRKHRRMPSIRMPQAASTSTSARKSASVPARRRAASRSSSIQKMTSSACSNFSPRAAPIAMPIRPITSLFDLDVTVSRETSSRPHVSYKGVFNRQWTFRKSRNLP